MILQGLAGPVRPTVPPFRSGRRTAPPRDLMGLPPVLARTGSFELRLARTEAELRRIQRLRYDVFYTKQGAVTDAFKASLRRDQCPFDRDCDHLYVAAVGPEASGRIVGTYRLLRSEVAAARDGFYSETAFRLEPLLARHSDKRLLELGRSCVHPAFRTRRVIDLLWSGIGRYAAHHGSNVLIGCSSLPGTNTGALAAALRFAVHKAAASADWQVEAQPSRAVRMDRLAPPADEDGTSLSVLPPLMKAYVRAGGTFASQAAVDHAFNTVDLFTVLPLAAAAPRYLARFGTTAAPVAA